MNKKNLIKIINKEITILSDFVEGFNDGGDINSIEVDMALSKARDIYDELLLLKGDDNVDSQLSPSNKHKGVAQDEKIGDSDMLDNIESRKQEDLVDEKPLQSEMVISEKEEQPELAEELSPVDELDKEIPDSVLPEAVEDSLLNNEAEIDDIEQIDSPDLQEDADTVEDEKQHDKSENEKPVEELDLPEQKPELKSKGGIVADKFSNETPSLNDMLASIKKNKNLASRLEDSPIKDLKKAIKLNDRIWYINELFNKNSATFEKAVDVVNRSSDLDAALEYLFTNFSWNQERKSTISFLELVFRRFAQK